MKSSVTAGKICRYTVIEHDCSCNTLLKRGSRTEGAECIYSTLPCPLYMPDKSGVEVCSSWPAVTRHDWFPGAKCEWSVVMCTQGDVLALQRKLNPDISSVNI
jgi:hypothetical protein